MLPRRTTRALAIVGLAIPALTVPPVLLAQAHTGPPEPGVWIESALKWWGVLSVFVIGGLHLWVRSIVRDHADSVREAAAAALKAHDENPSAHANHKNPQKYAVEIAEVRVALGDLKTQTAVILARIEAGQGAADGRWDAMEGRLDSVTAIEHRLAKIEGEHMAIHKLRGRE